MTTVLATPAVTVNTPTLEEEDVFANCFLSHEDFNGSRCMKALINQHPEAVKAPIISDKDLCGHDEKFGHGLIAEIKLRYPNVAKTGFIILCTGYGPKHHHLDTVQENFLVKRCMHACSL